MLMYLTRRLLQLISLVTLCFVVLVVVFAKFELIFVNAKTSSNQITVKVPKW